VKQRASGILMHITSLPSPYGLGDLGPGASQFLDFLGRAGQRVWQVLPLQPIDGAHGNSPYSSSSAFAGNILLVSPERLKDDGFLDADEIASPPGLPVERADYDAAREIKVKMFDSAWSRYQRGPNDLEFEQFREQAASWLEDFCLFVIIKRLHDGAIWSDWPPELRDRQPEALDEVRRDYITDLERIAFEQYVFFRQWRTLKEAANGRGIELFGDIPIYVNFDSADVWTHPRLFKLNDRKRPTVVAGVPPDYFSKTGQLWGNPVYDWEALRNDGYGWWLRRLEHMFNLYDIVRIDHFRGLVGYWEVPAGHKTAAKGKWAAGPGDDFLSVVKERFDGGRVVAEDLGTITDDVREAMKRFGFPGMKILQFAFGEDNPQHPYLPANFNENCVVYTGTHDNNTIVGWFENETDEDSRRRLFEYLGEEVPVERLPWELTRVALESRARLAVVPMQDLLALPASARMNIPATRNHNWSWRISPEQLQVASAGKLAGLVADTGRV
jgi:4-alpha-glucanotransferase